MKKHWWTPLFYALLGAVVLVVLALANLRAMGTELTPTIMIIPVMIGLVSGFLLGTTRKKLMEKSYELEKATEDLERKLEEVTSQEIITENLQRMVEKIPLPVYLKDCDHNYLLANGEYESLTGKSWSEIKGKTDYDIFPEPIADLFREQDEEVISQKSRKTFEETVPLVAGIITFQTFKFPLINDEGKVYAVGGICTDISNLKQAEDTLKSQQERLNVVLSEINEAVIATDSNNTIVMFNPMAAELTGHSADTAVGGALDAVYKTQDPETGADESFRAERTGKTKKVILTPDSGGPVSVTQKAVTLLDRFGQDMGVLIVFHPSSENRGAASENKFYGQDANSPSTESGTRCDDNRAEIISANILVMDDDALVRKTCGLMLATAGYVTHHAENGNEAVVLYEKMLSSESPIKAVIMDLTVPGAMGGVEATAKILELDPYARIIVASGYSNDPVLANFADYGFLARVEKPFALKKLIDTVQNLISL